MSFSSVIRKVSYGGIGGEGSSMEDSIISDVFQCDDGQGNGCGRMFDGLMVKRINGLCQDCAEDVPDNEGC